MLLLMIWLGLAACLVLLGRLLELDWLVGIGAVTLLMLLLVKF